MYNETFDVNSEMIYQQIKNEGQYNVNEIYRLKDEEYVFRPFKQYFDQAQEIATPLLQGIGQKLLPLISSVIEFFGKIIFVIFLIPRFQYMAVIFCEPVIWCVMAVQLVYSFYHNPYIKNN